MNLHNRILRLAKALPSNKASVTLSRADLIALLEDSPDESESIQRDLTVEEVAAEVGRAPSTIRGWLIAGRLRGYNLNGKSWRIPRSALHEYLDGQGRKEAAEVRIEEEKDDEDVDISAWRKIRDLR